MATVIGSATINIIPNTSGFSAQLNSQLKGVGSNLTKTMSGPTGALNGVRSSLTEFGDSLGRTSQRAVLAGGAMTYGLTRPLIGLASTMIETAATFDRSIRTIAAVGGLDVAGEDIQRISDKARELSRTFPQDAKQIADGMLDLARAGLDTADKIDAVIEPIMQLSTIEDVDLTKASETLINIFTGFGGSLKTIGADGEAIETIFKGTRTTTAELTAEFTRMSDVLATVSAATTTDLIDLGTAFRYAGPVAAMAGLDFEETASALGILAQAGMNACYSSDTEVLTRDGFRLWTEVTADTEFAAVDPVTHEMTYHKAINLYEFDHDGPMYHVATNKVDLLVTPNHRMWVKPDRNQPKLPAGQWGALEASEVKGKSVRYLKHVEWTGYTPEAYVLPGFDQGRSNWVKRIDDKVVDPSDWAAFMGYYIAEGSCRHRPSGYSVVLTQNEGPVKDEMCAVLDRMGFNYCVSGKNIEVSNQQLYNEVVGLGNTYEKHVPSYIKEWDRPLLRTFLEAFRQGDGDESDVLYTSSKGLMEDLQEVILKCGWAPRSVQRYEAGHSYNSDINGRPIVATCPGYAIQINNGQTEPQVYHANYKSKRYISQPKHHFEFIERYEHYTGKVYCAEVPGNLLVVRRNSQVVVCGNSVGGTALRGIITRLAIPTKLSQEIFEKFGLSVDEAFSPDSVQATADSAKELTKAMTDAGYSLADTDTAIRTKGVSSVEEYEKTLSGMGVTMLEVFGPDGQMKPLQEVVDLFVSKGARVGDVMKLFGQRAGPAFLALMNQSKAFKELTGDLDNVDGAMGEMADKILPSAAVQFQLLKNAMVDLAISVGESGVLDFFAKLSTRLTEFVRGVSETNPEVVKIIFVLGGLVAVLGPVTLAIGLLGQALSKTAHMFAFMLGPIGWITAAVAIVATGFGLMYSQSEFLRDAIGTLGQSLTAVLGPALEVARNVLAGLLGGTGNLAEVLGDRLAPVVLDVAEAINNWVSDGGLVAFLTGAVENVASVVDWIYELVIAIQDLGVMGAIGDAWSRIWGDMEGLLANFSGTLDTLIPDLVDLGTSVLVTVGAGFRILWQAGAAALSIIEKILDHMTPFLKLFGGDLVQVLTAAGLLFLLLRTRMSESLGFFGKLGAGIGAFAGNVGRSLTTLGIGVLLAGDKIVALGQRVARSIGGTASPAVNFLVDKFAKLTTAIGLGANFMGPKIAALGSAFAVLGRIAQITVASAQMMMAGFFSGMMAAKADDLKGRLVALVPAIVSMGIAFTLATGPIGLFAAALVGAATLIGVLVGREESFSGFTIDMSESINTLTQSMNDMGSSFDANDMLLEFNKITSEMSPKNFNNIATTLDKTGHSLDELGNAFMGGAKGAEEFAASVGRDFALKQVTGELKNFRFEVEKPLGFENEIVSPEDVQRLAEAGEMINIIDVSTGKAVGSSGDYSSILALLEKQFNDVYGGQAIKEFGVSLDAARAKQEAMGPIMKMQEENQQYINDKAKTWLDRIKDANTALDDTRDRLRNLFSPTDDADQQIADITKAIQSSKDGLINPQTGRPYLEIPPPNEAAGAAWFDAAKTIENEWVDMYGTIASQVPTGADVETQIQSFKNALLFQRVQFIETIKTNYGLTDDDAKLLADQITGALPTDEEIRIKILGLDESDIGAYEDRLKVLTEKFKNSGIDVRTVKILAEFEMDDTSAEAHALAKILSDGIPDISDEKLNIVVKSIDEMDPALRAWITQAILEGNVAPKNIPTFIELIPKIQAKDVSGVSAATLANLLSGEPPEEITQLIDLLPRIAELTGFSADESANIVGLLAKRSPEDVKQFVEFIPKLPELLPGLDATQTLALTKIIAGAPAVDTQKIIDVFPKVQGLDGLDETQKAELARIIAGKAPDVADKIIEFVVGNPALWAEIAPLVSQTTPKVAQIILDVIARGDVPALTSAADLAAAAAFAVNGGFGAGGHANGTITTGPEFALIGEAGPEAVIPLTRPERARQLMEQAGLFKMFPNEFAQSASATSAGSPLSPTSGWAPGAVSAATEATLGYAGAIWATAKASGLSMDAQGALMESMVVDFGTPGLDNAIVRAQTLTAALAEAQGVMASMGATGSMAEDQLGWDWRTMGNGLGPGGLDAAQFDSLGAGIQAELENAGSYGDAVSVLERYGVPVPPRPTVSAFNMADPDSLNPAAINGRSPLPGPTSGGATSLSFYVDNITVGPGATVEDGARVVEGMKRGATSSRQQIQAAIYAAKGKR